MSRKVIYLSLATVAVLASAAYSGTYSGGTGEPNNPYQIATAADMNEIGTHPEDWGAHFILIADVNMAEYTGTQFNVIGNSSTQFTGTFDGDGHEISNFTYTSTRNDWMGLFGLVAGSNSEIKNLGLINPNITINGGSYIAALVGHLSSGKISNCYVEGGSITSIYWNTTIGGLVARSTGEISNCHSTASVSAGDGYAGGLIGTNSSSGGTISNCYATGNVTGDLDAIGGLAGTNGGTIYDCYATGDITGDDEIGGLVGSNLGQIFNCYATGSALGDVPGNPGVWIGGLVGWNDSVISNCYATGSAQGENLVGGLVGDNYHGTITHCYSIGSVLSNNEVGGLVARNSGAVSESFWDTQTSGQATSASGTGKTTAEMQMDSTYLGWGCNGIWTIDEGIDYPRLSWQNMPGEPLTELADFLLGSGTVNDSFEIYTAEQLNTIGIFSCEWDKHFKLMADIDLSSYSGTTFNRLGINGPGTFDGNGKTISNFTYKSTEPIGVIGLFGSVSGSDAEIRDLGMIDPNIDAGAANNIGTLVGSLYQGTVLNCYSIGGKINGNVLIGGLVGYTNNGSIINCYSTVAVSGEGTVGGLVGYSNPGNISNSYATGSVTAAATAGGLVGFHYGSISNSYATGSVTGGQDSENLGGLVGECYSVSINNSYATATVSCGDSSDYIGGLVGYSSYGDIGYSYATGSVSTGQNSTYIAGLVGYGFSVSYPNWSFWNSSVNPTLSGIGNRADPPQVMAKTTAEMQTESTYTSRWWDFVTIWDICEGTNYPRFLWQIPAGDFLCPDGVNFIDYSFFASHWMDVNCDELNDYCEGTDLDGYGAVDINDLEIFISNWLLGTE